MISKNPFESSNTARSPFGCCVAECIMAPGISELMAIARAWTNGSEDEVSKTTLFVVVHKSSTIVMRPLSDIPVVSRSTCHVV